MSSQTRSTLSNRSSRGRENCAQPHLVFTNDDLLTEILIRLPILCIHLFASVSKQWQRILTSPDFTLSRSKIKNIDPPAGIFANCFRSHFKCNFVSFDSRLESKKPAIDLSFDEPDPADNIWISQSCNGLLLLTCSMPVSYHIYNPSTYWFRKLSQPNGVINNDSHFYISSVFRMTFDPRKSPYYKVIQAFHASDVIMFQIYSSETGKWRWSRGKFNYLHFNHFNSAIYWNDAFHWLEGLDMQVIHRKLNIEDDEHAIMSRLKIPRMFLEGKIFESYGCLFLVCRDYYEFQKLTIYEMMEGSSMWSVRYHINARELFFPYPSVWSICNIGLSIRLGEGEDDAVLMVAFSGKILTYNLVSKTINEISNQMGDYAHGYSFNDPLSFDANLYEFIPSFACVCDASQITDEPKKRHKLRRSTRKTRVPAKLKE